MNLSGVLFFPVTPFAPSGEPAVDALAEHIGRGLEHGPGAVFAACGTGEFADGLLLMPPYLSMGTHEGFVAYVRAVAAILPVIVYQRGSVVLTPAQVVELARLPGVIGLKDGLGDIDLMQRIVLAVRKEVGDGFTFFNGLPTAELTMGAYRGLGVELYSSAAFAFAPDIATAYLNGAHHLLTEFYEPLVRLRAKVPGYAVALVKAGVRLGGVAAGSVRAPLVDASPEDVAELEALIKHGRSLVGTS